MRFFSRFPSSFVFAVSIFLFDRSPALSLSPSDLVCLRFSSIFLSVFSSFLPSSFLSPQTYNALFTLSRRVHAIYDLRHRIGRKEALLKELNEIAASLDCPVFSYQLVQQLLQDHPRLFSV